MIDFENKPKSESDNFYSQNYTHCIYMKGLRKIIFLQETYGTNDEIKLYVQTVGLGLCVCVCVCVREREREREKEHTMWLHSRNSVW